VPKIARILVAPGGATVTQVSAGGAVPVPIRRAGRFDDLAADLGRRLDVPAEVREGTPGALVPGAGTLVVCRPDVLDHLARAYPAALPWVVAVDLLRNHVLDEAELHGLAAAVEALAYEAWVYGDARPPAVYGRLDVAKAIGAEVSTDPLGVGARYGRFTHPRADSLPALLALYLAALDPLLP
jgi:hypothetical protein